MTETKHTIDFNHLYGFTLQYSQEEHALKVTLDDDNHPSARFSEALVKLLRVDNRRVDGKTTYKDVPARQRKVKNGKIFSDVNRRFVLRLGDEPIGEYSIDLHGHLTQEMWRPLTIAETRRIGTFHDAEPYPLMNENVYDEKKRALVTLAKNTITTDFHTHSSGQITAHGLLDVAMKRKPYYYPIDLLKKAGINTSYADIPQKDRKPIERIPFLDQPGVVYPKEVEGADLHALSEADRKKLEEHMMLPTDRQSTFTEMENEGYRFRYPFSKDTSLIRDTLRKMAQEYAAQGIDYACISYVGLEKPEILRAVHETLEELKRDPTTKNVEMRFKVGIPRGLPLPVIEEKLECAKILMDSPYIIGVDALGFESNKTREFAHLFDDFEKWANEHKPRSFHRFHAGENDKNRENVKDFLKMANKYDKLVYLVGHGLYGNDETTAKLAHELCKDPENPRLFIEFNPDSNIALNNIDDLKEVPYGFAREHHIPYIVASDSAGMYSTSAEQLGINALYGGMDEEGFRLLGMHQQELQRQQLAYSASIAAGIKEWDVPAGKMNLLASLCERLKNVPKAVIEKEVVTDEMIANKLKQDRVTMIEPGETVPELAGKAPIIFFGASGETWNRMTPGQQREAAIAVDMLIHASKAGTSYIGEGRPKSVGLAKVVTGALKSTNKDRDVDGTSQLYNCGILINPDFGEKTSYKHLTHMERVQGQRIDVADAIVDHAFAHNGVLVGIGGSAYTRDIILKADLGNRTRPGIRDSSKDNNKMMLLLQNAEGASAQKAGLLHPDYAVSDGKQLLKTLVKYRPELFSKKAKDMDFNKLYQQSSARVAAYGYGIENHGVISGPKEHLGGKKVTIFTDKDTDQQKTK